MNHLIYIARRLSFSDGERKSLPAVKVALAAVAISVTVMISAVWIVLGFKHEIMEKVTGFNPDITLYMAEDSPDGSNTILLTPTLEQTILDVDGVEQVAPSLAMPAVFKTAEDFKGVYLKNIATDRMRNFLTSSLKDGVIPDYKKSENEEKIVISEQTSKALGLKAGDKIDTYFITDAIRVRRLEVAGVYNSHFDAYDEVYVFGSVGLMRKIQNLKENRSTSLHLTVDKFDNIALTAQRLQSRMIEAYSDGTINYLYNADTVLQTGAGYLNWLNLLDTNVIVIIVLMLVVGSVTLVSGMLIIVLDKKRFIGIMRAMGCSANMLQRVFVLLSMRVTIKGLLIGDILATAFLWCQNQYHFLKLDADAYYIDFVPVSMNFWWLLAINAGVLAVSYAVLLLPARFIRKISPAETMRDEG